MSTTLFDIPAASPPARAGGSDFAGEGGGGGGGVGGEQFPAAAVVLAEVFGRILVPPPRLGVPEWVAAHRVVTASGGAHRGAWQHWRTPHAPTIMRSIGGADLGGDPATREVVLMFAAQLGKTETLINGVLACCAQVPAPVVWTVPDETWAARFTANRVYPAVREIPALMQRLAGPPSRAMKGDLFTLDNGAYVHWASSRSESANVGTPARLRCADEIDSAGFDAAQIEHLRRRAGAWPGGMLVLASTPSYEGVGIDAEYAATDRRAWHVPCPACGRYQVLEFGRLKWLGGGSAPRLQVAQTLVYSCVHCETGIEPERNPWMQARGVWCPEGVVPAGDGRRITDDMIPGGYVDDTEPAVMAVVQLSGTPVVTDRTRVGYRLSALNSLLLEGGWREIAGQFVTMHGRPSREWTNTVLGEADSGVKGDRASKSDLEALCSPPRVHGGYELGELPGGPGGAGASDGWGYGAPLGTGHLAHFGGPRAIVVSVDVQPNRMYVLARAYGLDGARTWLVWYDEIASSEGDNLGPLDAVLEWWFPWQVRPGRDAIARGGFLGSLGLGVSAIAVDSGDRTGEVYAWCRKARLWAAARGRRLDVFPVKGQRDDGGGVFAEPFTRTSIDVDATGKRIPGSVGGLELIGPRVGTWKDTIYARLVAARELVAKSGGDLRAAGWYLPEADSMPKRGSVYLSSLCSEQRVPIKDKDGRYRATRTRWVKRPGLHGQNNHYWDCEVYNACVAEVVGVRSMVSDGGAGAGAGAGGGAGGVGGGGGGGRARGRPLVDGDWLGGVREAWGGGAGRVGGDG